MSGRTRKKLGSHIHVCDSEKVSIDASYKYLGRAK